MSKLRMGAYIWIIVYIGLTYYTLVYLMNTIHPIVICLILILNVYYIISKFIEEIEYHYKKYSIDSLPIDIAELSSVITNVDMMEIHSGRADEIIDNYVEAINTGKMKMWKIDIIPEYSNGEPIITMLLTDTE